jgi:hypothetical protein
MWTAFNVAASAMAFADGRAAIGTGSECLAHGFFSNLQHQVCPPPLCASSQNISNNAAVSVSPFALRLCSVSSRLMNRRVAQEVGAPTDADHLHGFAPAAQRFPDERPHQASHQQKDARFIFAQQCANPPSHHCDRTNKSRYARQLEGVRDLACSNGRIMTVRRKT